MAKKRNLKVVRGDLDNDLDRLVDIILRSQIGDTRPKVKKGKSKRVTKAFIPKDQPLSDIEKLIQRMRRSGNFPTPSQLEQGAYKELGLESILDAEDKSALNERKIKRAILGAVDQDSSGKIVNKKALALRNKDATAIEQEFIDDLVKQGMSEKDAKLSAESFREELYEGERKIRRRDPKKADMKSTPYAGLGRDETPSLGGTQTDERGRKINAAMRAKKAASFSIEDQANYSRFEFKPGTGKAAGAFSITRVNAKTGQPLKFTKDSKNRLAKLFGEDKLQKMTTKGGNTIQYISSRSLLKAVKNNPELGALIDNPKFISAFSRDNRSKNRDLQELRKRYDKAKAAEGASDDIKDSSRVVRKRLTREGQRLQGDPVITKGKRKLEMSKTQRKKLAKEASLYDRRMKQIEDIKNKKLPSPRKPSTPPITTGAARFRFNKLAPLLAIASAIKGLK